MRRRKLRDLESSSYWNLGVVRTKGKHLRFAPAHLRLSTTTCSAPSLPPTRMRRSPHANLRLAHTHLRMLITTCSLYPLSPCTRAQHLVS